MGSKKTTETKSAEHAVTTPQTPEYLKGTYKNYAGKIDSFLGMDPASMVAGPSALQRLAFGGAPGLGGSMGWRGALGGGLQGLGQGLMDGNGWNMDPNTITQNFMARFQQQPRPANNLSLLNNEEAAKMQAQAAPAPVQQAPVDPNQQYIDQLQQQIAKTYGNLNLNPYG